MKTKTTDTPTGAVIVLVPAASDPIRKLIDDPGDAHVTLAYLGVGVGVGDQLRPGDLAGIKRSLADDARLVDGPIIAVTSGVAVLGDDRARVVLVEAPELELLHELVSSTSAARRALANATDPHPHYVPHLTVGYSGKLPDPDAVPATVTLDRIELWCAGERFGFPLGQPLAASGRRSDEQFSLASVAQARAQVAAMALVPPDPDPDDPGSIARYLRFCDENPNVRIFAVKTMQRLALEHLVEPMNWPEYLRRTWTDDQGNQWRVATDADLDVAPPPPAEPAGVGSAPPYTARDFWRDTGRRPDPESPAELIARVRAENLARGFKPSQRGDGLSRRQRAALAGK